MFPLKVRKAATATIAIEADFNENKCKQLNGMYSTSILMLIFLLSL